MAVDWKKELEKIEFQSSFFANSLKGGIAKLIVMNLFREAGYQVYPFGYESTFSVIKEELKDCTDPMSLRIRHMPDILVFKRGDKKHTALIEVKYCKSFDAIMKNLPFNDYQNYWGDAFLLYVTPHEEVFYIQKLSDIKPVKVEGHPNYYAHFDLKRDFKEITAFEEFKNIDISKLKRMRGLVKNIDKFLEEESDGAPTKSLNLGEKNIRS